ncbi:MAG: hypothetical protein AAB581_01055 [Patescibacteria group bacterium]
MGGGKVGQFENFCTNDMTAFATVAEARIAKKELLVWRDIHSVSLGMIQIELAETIDEAHAHF